MADNLHIRKSYFSLPSEGLKTQSTNFVVLESILICKQDIAIGKMLNNNKPSTAISISFIYIIPNEEKSG